MTAPNAELLRLGELLRLQKLDEARALVDRLLDTAPEAPAVLLAAADLALRSRKTASVPALLARAETAGANRFEMLVLRRRHAEQSRDTPALIACLTELVALRPNRHDLRAALAAAHWRAGEAPQARTLAQLVRSRAPDLALPYRVLFEIAYAERDLEEMRRIVEAAIASAAPFPRFPELVEFSFLIPAHERAGFIRRLCDRWPEYLQDAGAQGLRPVADTAAEEALQHEAITLAIQGDAVAAQAAIARLPEGNAVVRGIRKSELPDMLAKVPAAADRKRPVIRDTPDDMLCSAPGESGVTVLFFTGLLDRAMSDVALTDCFVAQAGATSVFLRDYQRRFFLLGVESLGADMDSTLASLRIRLAELGTRRLICIGSSAGGYGAMIYGLALGAERIVCLAAPTCMTEEFAREHGDTRGPMVRRKILEIPDPFGHDLRNRLVRAHVPQGVWMYFGAQSPIDRAHAEHLADLPDVVLKPLENFDRHNLVVPLILRGELAACLKLP